MCLGIPGKIVEIDRDSGLTMGTVDFGGVRREVCLEYVADDEAKRTFEVLREMSQLDELDWIEEVAQGGGA